MNIKQDEDSPRRALLIREAVVQGGNPNRSVIVTANEDEIVFTNGHNMFTGIKFTMSEWMAIKRFVMNELGV